MKIGYLNKHLSIILSTFLFAGSSLYAQKNHSEKETKDLEEVTIMGESESKYASNSKPNISRGKMELDDLSKSAQIFNEEFITEFQPTQIDDIVLMSSNTLYLGDSSGRESQFVIRGFSNVPVLRDGFNIDNSISEPEMYNIQSIEVLKGPDSLQFGESNPGGLINIVKKKPQKESHAQAAFDFSSNTSFSPKVDIGGALNEDGSARFRFISLYKEDKGFKNFNNSNKRIFVAPSFAYDINDNHTITLSTEYLNEEKQLDHGTVVKSNGELATPIETVTSHPDELIHRDQKVFGLDLESNFDGWDSLFKYRHINFSYLMPNTLIPVLYTESTNTLTRRYSNMRQNNEENAFQYTLNTDFEVLNVKNRLTTGIDYRQLNQSFAAVIDGTNYNLNLSNPSYGTLPTSSDHPAAAAFGGTGTDMTRYGAFIQNHMDITQNLILSTGLRYDKVKAQENEDKDSTVYQLGVVYKLTPNTTLFANAAESFYPQTLSDKDGKLLDPEEGIGFEMGIKQKLFNENLNLTAAIFKIEKENVGISDPNNAFKYIASGKQESSGFEIDLMGDITPLWSIVASYGYTASEDKGDYKGKELAGVPRHTANIFTTYDLASFGYPNSYVGGGAQYIGSRYVNQTNTVEIDDNIIFNASLGYKKGPWSANFSVKNLTNEEYIESTSGFTFRNLYAGAPRTFLATLSYSF